MSPSAWNRDHGDQIFYTLGFLEHLEARGVRVLNGLAAYRSELSKAGQLALLESLGLPYPKSRVIHRASQAPAATVRPALSRRRQTQHRRLRSRRQALRPHLPA